MTTRPRKLSLGGDSCREAVRSAGHVRLLDSPKQMMLRVGAKGRHAAIVWELELPVPFDLDRFVARLERQRKRPIWLRSFSSGPGCPCGLWIGTADGDYIYYEAGTTPFHATIVALHEIAHVLLGHGHAAARDQIVRLLARRGPGTLIHLILGRSACTTAAEREADTLGSIILSNAAN